jgi:hypothetical protein
LALVERRVSILLATAAKNIEGGAFKVLIGYAITP